MRVAKSRRGPGRPRAEESRETMLRDAEAAYLRRERGYSIEAISLRLGISERTVHRALNRTEPIRFVQATA